MVETARSPDGLWWKLVMSWQNLKPIVCMAWPEHPSPLHLYIFYILYRIYLDGWITYQWACTFFKQCFMGMISMDIFNNKHSDRILSMIGVFWSLIELVNDFITSLEWSMTLFFSMIGIFFFLKMNDYFGLWAALCVRNKWKWYGLKLNQF